MNNNKYFAYIRKSTDVEDKQELSLEAQKHEIEDYAQREHVNIIKWFEEKRSAKAPGRPDFNEMMNLFRQDCATGLIAHKPDRLSRNWHDVGQICQLWSEKNLDLVFVTGRFENNAQGQAMFGMQSLMAKFYIDNLSEETKKGQKESIRIGFFPGVPPLGYLTKMEYLKLTGNETKVREIDPLRAPIVTKAFEYYDIGKFSLKGIVEWAYEQGFRSRTTKRKPEGKVGKAAWYGILTNPFYYGRFEWLGALHKGNHKPLIDYELWERVNARLKSRGHRFVRIYGFPFKLDQFKCGECGAGITAEEKFQLICSKCKYKFHYKNKRSCPKCKILIQEMTNPTYLHYIYYHCTKSRFHCSQSSVTHDYLQKELVDAIAKITLPQELLETFKDELKAGLQEEQNFRDVSLQNLNIALGIAQSRRDKLLELYIDEKLTKEQFDKKNEEYQHEIIKLEGQIQRLKETDKKWYDTAILYLELSQRAKDLFVKASDQRKTELLNFVFQNLTLRDKQLTLTYKKPFDILINCQKSSLLLPLIDVLRNNINLDLRQDYINNFLLLPLR